MDETEYTESVICPYCGYDCGGEDMARGQDDEIHHECGECGKTFIYHTNYDIRYFSRQADCLNGSPHDYRSWVTVLKKDGQATQTRYCQRCRRGVVRTLPQFLFRRFEDG